MNNTVLPFKPDGFQKQKLQNKITGNDIYNNNNNNNNEKYKERK